MRVRKQRLDSGKVLVELLGEEGEPVEVVSGFLRSLAARDYSPNTLVAYAHDLGHLWDFFARDGLTWEEFAAPQSLSLLEYLRSVPSRRPRQRMALTEVLRDYKSVLEPGHCLRRPAEGPCECDLYLTCAKFVTTPDYAPRLRARLEVEQQLVQDADDRGWTREVERHTSIGRRLQGLLAELGESFDPDASEMTGQRPCTSTD